MRPQVEEDRRRRSLVKKWEKKRRLLKSMLKDERLPMQERLKAQNKLRKLPRDSSETRIRNRCTVTGRGRGISRKLKLSRIMIRELALTGKLSGFTKVKLYCLG